MKTNVTVNNNQMVTQFREKKGKKNKVTPFEEKEQMAMLGMVLHQHSSFSNTKCLVNLQEILET